MTRRTALSFVLIISAVNLLAGERSVSFPSSNILVKEEARTDKKPDYDFRIAKVSVSSERTAVSCELNFRKKVKRNFSIEENCALFYRTADSVAMSFLTSSDGILIHRYGDFSQEKTLYKANEKLEFTLYFAPLPDDVNSFDFIESLFSSWNRVDISLSEGAPSGEEQRTGECPFDDVIKYPTFLGRDRNSFSRWVNAHLVYPDGLRNAGIEGQVKLLMSIDVDGTTGYEIVKYSEYAFNAEALRVVNSAPKWSPATIRGVTVKCHFIFPVIFKLHRHE